MFKSSKRLKLGRFTSLPRWERGVQKSAMHVQSYCFANLNLLLFGDVLKQLSKCLAMACLEKS